MKLTLKQSIAALGVGIAALATSQAQAQTATAAVTPDSLVAAQNALLRNALTAPNAGPAVSFGSPVAFGADWGTVGIGVGGVTLDQNQRKNANDNSFDNRTNGAAGIVIGLGNSRDAFGLETAVSSYSLTNKFGDSGGVALKAHTQLPGSAAFAVGVENIGRWGDARNSTSSAYVVGTKIIPIGVVPVSLNIGAGDGRFRDGNGPGNHDIGIFGSIAILSPYKKLPASLIADWSGRYLNAGVSIVPFARYGLVLTGGAVNLNGRDGHTEFSGAVGYSYRF